MTVTRRTFLALSATSGLATVAGLGAAAAVEPAGPGPGPYGELGPPDANGIALPAGFTSRIVAVAGETVPGPTGHVWHTAPDGGAVFGQDDGGWVYVSNEENNDGGVGALRFDRDGSLVDGYRILDGTRRNCAGGPTPWGTWLSCEEVDGGLVFECAVSGPGEGVVRPALGAFVHEAAAVDASSRSVILTEDQPDGRLYRFTPDRWADDGVDVLGSGSLEAARVEGFDGPGPWAVSWQPAAQDRPDRSDGTTRFSGGEGAWSAGGHVYFTTKGDGRVWDLDVANGLLDLLYDRSMAMWDDIRAPLTGVDNVTVSPGGEVFVAEDGGNMELVVIGERDGRLEVAPFLRFVGHDASEVTGPAFHADGTRLYVSSQRGADGGPDGLTVEITGPFTPRPTAPAISTTTSAPPVTEESVSETPAPVGEAEVAAPADAADDDGVPVAPAAIAAAGLAGAGIAATVAFRRRREPGVADPGRRGPDAP